MDVFEPRNGENARVYMTRVFMDAREDVVTLDKQMEDHRIPPHTRTLAHLHTAIALGIGRLIVGAAIVVASAIAANKPKRGDSLFGQIFGDR